MEEPPSTPKSSPLRIAIPQHSKVYTTTPTKKRHTSTSLLASFGAQQSPTSVTTQLRQKMAERELRHRQTVSYKEPDGDSSQASTPLHVASPALDDEYQVMSDDEQTYNDDFDGVDWSSTTIPKSFIHTIISTPPSSRENSKEDEVSTEDITPRERRSGLRPASATQPRYLDNYSTKLPSRRVVPKMASPRMPTARNLIRNEIQRVTKAKADAFLRLHHGLFLSLLPSHDNYVQRLLQFPEERELVLQRDVPQPKGINAVMKPYQLKGLAFLVHMYNNGMSAILGDEMGLGKTLQTLSLLQYLKEQEELDPFRPQESRPSLIICPLTILQNWAFEAKKFTPGLAVFRFHGPSSERTQLKLETKLKPYDTIITTFETFLKEKDWFKRAFAWKYLILDEGQKIKNYKSDVSHAVQGLQAEYRLLLTGTPLQNDMTELWSLLHWLLPRVFVEKTLPLFKTAFDLGRGKVDKNVLEQSRDLLELMMLRRTKTTPGVDLNLPTKDIVRLFVPLTPLQKKWYKRLLTLQSNDLLEEVFKDIQSKEIIAKTASGSRHLETTSGYPPTGIGHEDLGNSTEISRTNSTSWKKLHNLILQLRKICNHPYLIEDAAPINDVGIGGHIAKASGKFIALQKLIEELVVTRKKKILIFSQFTEVLGLVEDLLEFISMRGGRFRYVRFDGSTNRARRNLYVRLFQQKDSDYRVMLISTKAGGLGLNLTAATESIFIDEDWNPQVDLQAEARCHRIGQTKPVTIYKLCTAGTVEEQMLGRIHKKLYLSAKITETMQNIHDSPPVAPNADVKLSQAKAVYGSWSEFKSLLRRGTKTLANGSADSEQMADWDFEAMIDNCCEKAEATSAEADDTDEDKWLSTMERVECAVFDGKRYAREKWQEPQLESPCSRAERRVGKNVTVLIDGEHVNKASLGCDEGEAVATWAGKDPSLKEITRTREKINHQASCQNCQDTTKSGESVLECNNCPRVYHLDCLVGCPGYENVATASQFNWNCPQHKCAACKKSAVNVGGMIFRCRWCVNGYCEDCIDWDKTKLLGDTLDEYKALAYLPHAQGYYIICPRCNVPEIEEAMAYHVEIYQAAAEAYEGHLPFDMKAQFAEDEHEETNDHQPRTTEAEMFSDTEVVPPATPDTATNVVYDSIERDPQTPGSAASPQFALSPTMYTPGLSASSAMYTPTPTPTPRLIPRSTFEFSAPSTPTPILRQNRPHYAPLFSDFSRYMSPSPKRKASREQHRSDPFTATKRHKGEI